MEWLNYHHLLYFWTVVREGGDPWIENATVHYRPQDGLEYAIRERHRGSVDAFLLYAVLEHMTVYERLLVLRMPLATPRIFPEPWVISVMILSASPSLCCRSTTPCSLYRGTPES